MAKSPEELGAKMAHTLLAELTVPLKPLSEDTISKRKLKILDEVPGKGEFFNYTENGVQIEPTKEALLEYLLNDKQSLVAFCCISLQTVNKLSVDIDHVFPRARITEKQNLLLNYLNDPNNDNAKFAQAFMGENPVNDELKNKIGEYFKRDFITNKIKCTQWFVDVCYNDLNNLFHLKNYLNREKKDKDPEEWFGKALIQKIKEEIAKKGGINDGVIMKQIFPIFINENGVNKNLDCVDLGNDSKGKQIKIYLRECAEERTGVGVFVRQWFRENAQEIIKNSVDIHNINEKLTKMLNYELGNNQKEGVEKFIVTIDECLKLADKRRSNNTWSGSDSSEGVEGRRYIIDSVLLRTFDDMHLIKQFKKQALTCVDAASKDEVAKNFHRLCADNLFNLDPKGFELALAFLKNQITNKQQSNTYFTADDIRTLIVNAGKAGSSEEARKETAVEKQQKEEVTQKWVVAEQNAAVERQRADAAEQNVVAERQRADAAEQGRLRDREISKAMTPLQDEEVEARAEIKIDEKSARNNLSARWQQFLATSSQSFASTDIPQGGQPSVQQGDGNANGTGRALLPAQAAGIGINNGNENSQDVVERPVVRARTELAPDTESPSSGADAAGGKKPPPKPRGK